MKPPLRNVTMSIITEEKDSNWVSFIKFSLKLATFIIVCLMAYQHFTGKLW